MAAACLVAVWSREKEVATSGVEIYSVWYLRISEQAGRHEREDQLTSGVPTEMAPDK
jgi:hypothetical protein